MIYLPNREGTQSNLFLISQISEVAEKETKLHFDVNVYGIPIDFRVSKLIITHSKFKVTNRSV